MAGHQGQDVGGHRAGVDGLDAVQAEEGVGLHHRADGQVGNLAAVGHVDVADQVAQAQDGLDEQVAFLAGAVQLQLFLAGDQVIGALHAALEILLAPVNGGQAVLPGLDHLGILVVPAGHELYQVTVARRSDGAVAAEQIHLDLVRAGEGGVHPVLVAALFVAVHMLGAELLVQGEDIHILVGGAGQPGEVVDAVDGGVQLVTVHLFDAQLLLEDVAQQLLGAEDLMATAKGLDLREHLIQGADGQRHGVGVVDDPGLGRVIADGLADLHKHGDGAHRAHEAAGADGIAHGLVHAHALRQFIQKLSLDLPIKTLKMERFFIELVSAKSPNQAIIKQMPLLELHLLQLVPNLAHQQYQALQFLLLKLNCKIHKSLMKIILV